MKCDLHVNGDGSISLLVVAESDAELHNLSAFVKQATSDERSPFVLQGGGWPRTFDKCGVTIGSSPATPADAAARDLARVVSRLKDEVASHGHLRDFADRWRALKALVDQQAAELGEE